MSKMENLEFAYKLGEKVTDALLDLYEKTITVLYKGIESGKTNAPLGLLSFEAFIDLLHGGAYNRRIQELPYYTPLVQNQLSGDVWTSILNAIGQITGFILSSPLIISLPDGSEIALPKGAKPEQVEAIIDSNIPHRFPKLLSDQAFFVMKEWISIFFTVEGFRGVTTGLNTLVEGFSEVSDTKEGRKGLSKREQQLLRALTPLLSTRAKGAG